jgi:hypothetical protein
MHGAVNLHATMHACAAMQLASARHATFAARHVPSGGPGSPAVLKQPEQVGSDSFATQLQSTSVVPLLLLVLLVVLVDVPAVNPGGGG